MGMKPRKVVIRDASKDESCKVQGIELGDGVSMEWRPVPMEPHASWRLVKVEKVK